MSLNVVLGDVLPPPNQQHLHQSRNEPSRQQRQVKRDQEREAANAEEIKKATVEKASTEEMIDIVTVKDKDATPVTEETRNRIHTFKRKCVST